MFGLGECSIIPGLSPDHLLELEPFLQKVVKNIQFYIDKPEKVNHARTYWIGDSIDAGFGADLLNENSVVEDWEYSLVKRPEGK